VVFTKGGKLVRDDAGNLLRIPFDMFNPIEKSADKEIFMRYNLTTKANIFGLEYSV
jgi:hypothetical protein